MRRRKRRRRSRHSSLEMRRKSEIHVAQSGRKMIRHHILGRGRATSGRGRQRRAKRGREKKQKAERKREQRGNEK